jgi:hypothetical protein
MPFSKNNMVKDISKNSLRVVFAIITLCGCNLFTPAISSFDHYSYVHTTSIKVDALNLIDMATDSFQLHEKEIKNIQSDIQKIKEYEKHRPKNDITIKLWEVLTDTNGNLLGKFVIRWQRERILKLVYVQEKRKQISLAFDQIAELESGKIKSLKKSEQ